MRKTVIKGVRKYLSTGVSDHFRGRIYAAAAAQARSKGLVRTDGRFVGWTPMNRLKRELLADAIFAVEDELESRADGQPYHPQVVALNKARNLVLDDLGWNDPSIASGSNDA